MNYGRPNKPRSELLSSMEAQVPTNCFRGKVALYMVSKHGKSMDGFCAEHKEDAEKCGRNRYRFHEKQLKPELTDSSKPKREPFKRVKLSDK